MHRLVLYLSISLLVLQLAGGLHVPYQLGCLDEDERLRVRRFDAFMLLVMTILRIFFLIVKQPRNLLSRFRKCLPFEGLLSAFIALLRETCRYV